MRPRTLVANRLRAALEDSGATDIVVLDHARTLDHLVAPTVVVTVDAIAPSPAAQAWVTCTCTALVIAPRTDPGAADDALDDALMDVLVALDGDASPITWSQARRGTAVDDTWPAYLVTLTATLTKEI